MQAGANDPKRYFANIHPDLPDAVLITAIEDAAQSFREGYRTADDAGGDITLTDDDVVVLRRLAWDERVNVRREAIEVICEFGPLTWEDLDAWVGDPDECIRQAVVEEMDEPSTPPLRQLLADDPQRYIHLLASVTERYADSASMWALMHLSKNPSYLDLVWPEINRLLDLDKQDIRTNIQVQYLEEIITEYNWGLEDPHLRPWIQGHDATRQTLLLMVASWEGLYTAQYKAIVEALTHVDNSDIADLAREILAGKVRFSDADGWFVWVKEPGNE